MTRFKSKTLVIPQFVAGEHGLFGGHKSEDIRTFLVLSLRGRQVNSRQSIFLLQFHFTILW